MQSSSTFVRISGPIPEVKRKPALRDDWENIAYWEELEKSKALAKKFGLFQIQSGGSGGSRDPRFKCQHLN